MDNILHSPTSLPSVAQENLRNLYFELIKNCLTDLIYEGSDDQQTLQEKPFNKDLRVTGSDRPARAHTMIGLKRLTNLQYCVEDIIRTGVPGDLIETGVWRGGATILMRAILKAYDVRDRLVWVADSFEGLPAPDASRYPADEGHVLHEEKELAVSMEQVQSNFGRYGLLDEQVVFLKGWFKDTLPTAPIKSLAIIRLDGDMYESTMDGLVNLYPKLSPGGYLLVDDYGCYESCRQAVDEYRAKYGIHDEIQSVDWTGVYWRRSS